MGKKRTRSDTETQNAVAILETHAFTELRIEEEQSLLIEVGHSSSANVQRPAEKIEKWTAVENGGFLADSAEENPAQKKQF